MHTLFSLLCAVLCVFVNSARHLAPGCGPQETGYTIGHRAVPDLQSGAAEFSKFVGGDGAAPEPTALAPAPVLLEAAAVLAAAEAALVAGDEFQAPVGSTGSARRSSVATSRSVATSPASTARTGSTTAASSVRSAAAASTTSSRRRAIATAQVPKHVFAKTKTCPLTPGPVRSRCAAHGADARRTPGWPRRRGRRGPRRQADRSPGWSRMARRGRGRRC